MQSIDSVGWFRPPLSLRAKNGSAKVKMNPREVQPLSLRSRLSGMIPAGAKNGLASALASAMVKVTMQPFDTVKTIQQMDNRNLGIFKTTATFVKQRGVAALWSGTGLAVVGSAPAIATYFAIFNAAKVRLTKVMPPKYRPVAVALSATIANTAASVLRAPYEVSAPMYYSSMVLINWLIYSHLWLLIVGTQDTDAISPTSLHLQCLEALYSRRRCAGLVWYRQIGRTNHARCTVRDSHGGVVRSAAGGV